MSSRFGFQGSLQIGDSGTELDDVKLTTVVVDPASIAANTTANVDVALPAGTAPAALSHAYVEPPDTLEHGLVCQGASIPSADTLRLRISNVTAGAIDGASRTWKLLIVVTK